MNREVPAHTRKRDGDDLSMGDSTKEEEETHARRRACQSASAQASGGRSPKPSSSQRGTAERRIHLVPLRLPNPQQPRPRLRVSLSLRYANEAYASVDALLLACGQAHPRHRQLESIQAVFSCCRLAPNLLLLLLHRGRHIAGLLR